jgi:hypothetical protein
MGMLDLKGIEIVMKKLGDETQPGEIRFTASRGGENRFSYYFNGQLIFTFGLTRGSRQKSKHFHYVPRQMHLQRRQYQELHDCPMSKAEYNQHLVDSGKVRLKQ